MARFPSCILGVGVVFCFILGLGVVFLCLVVVGGGGFCCCWFFFFVFKSFSTLLTEELQVARDAGMGRWHVYSLLCPSDVFCGRTQICSRRVPVPTAAVGFAAAPRAGCAGAAGCGAHLASAPASPALLAGRWSKWCGRF